MVIQTFDLLQHLYGVAPCPECNGAKMVFTATVSSPSDEEWARRKLYGEYDEF